MSGGTVGPIPAAGPVAAARAVYLVDQLTAPLLRAAANGSVVLLVDTNASAPADPSVISFPGLASQFKTAWWLGNPSDNHMGTDAYPTLSDEIAPGAAPDGWADEGWVSLMSSLACLRAS